MNAHTSIILKSGLFHVSDYGVALALAHAAFLVRTGQFREAATAYHILTLCLNGQKLENGMERARKHCWLLEQRRLAQQ